MAESFTRDDVVRLLDSGELAVKRSARRKKSVSLRRSGGVWVLATPLHYDPYRYVDDIAQMLTRLQRRGVAPHSSDAELFERAAQLNTTYFSDDLGPRAAVWVNNQNSRWASCDAGASVIRVSHRLKEVPAWVLDAVLVHELAHLRESNHNENFWALANRYPRMSDSDIFLEGFSYGEAFRAGP